MLLKAGTYRFNDELDFPNEIPFEEPVGRYAEITIECNSTTYSFLRFMEQGDIWGMAYQATASDPPVFAYMSAEVEGMSKGWQDTTYQEHTLPDDVEVTDSFGTWYISNTNYNEVNAPVEDTIYTEKSSWYKSVADAIRSKKGTTSPILRDNFASEISSITGGGETPYYDGTVIIEKANSVLGLRRFKESFSSALTVVETQEAMDKYLAGEIQTSYPLSFVSNGVTYSSILCLRIGGTFTINSQTVTYPTAYRMDYDTTQVCNELDLGWVDEAYKEINVLECNDKTVIAWLLANTEGVSV